jgi:hypothetical protein
MKHRSARLFFVLPIAALLAAMPVRAAETPVATAPLPPPVPTTPAPGDTPYVLSPNAPAAAAPPAANPRPARSKRAVAAKQPMPPGAAGNKTAARAVKARTDRKRTAGGTARPATATTGAKPVQLRTPPRPHEAERRHLASRAHPPRWPAMPPPYGPGDLLPGAGDDAPPFPPPWYYRGPRGPW